MDATKMATFTGIVGIEYHLQEQLVHPKASITTEDDIHTPNTPETNLMTEEAIADLILGLTKRQKHKPLKTPQRRQTREQGQKSQMKAHAQLQPSSKLITSQAVLR